MQQSNPIQQRIEWLSEKWTNLVGQTKAPAIRIVHTTDEEDMIDTFFTYMHSLDSSVEDISFQFDDVFTNREEYSKLLLQSLTENIRIWNESEKESNVPFEPIDWQPDYNKTNKLNPAWLFIANFNDLVQKLEVEPEYAVVLTLTPMAIGNTSRFTEWVQNAIDARPHKQVKILVADNAAKPMFDHMAHNPQVMATLVADLDMPNAMQQVAAMGDANEPSTPYRVSFIKLMQAMTDKNDKLVYEEGNKCLAIANENIEKDSYWLTQKIVIFCAWSNYELGRREFKKAIEYADQGVEAARLLSPLLHDDLLGGKYLAQTVMQRAAVYVVWKRWEEALADYSLAAQLYHDGNEYILGTEAYRMCAYVALKDSKGEEATAFLATGIRFGQYIPATHIHGTTYAALFEMILSRQFEKHISFQEMEDIAQPIYGDDWVDKVRNWKEIPANILEPADS
ncbi:hypothetical protein SAMN05421788_106320 [Filimonas lacunae]|uniref:Tetratricopeptide repeat-containing protein n=1 Tax=Filimonas lacunae TaxID=477680 RepID=A0A173MF73_9BACT|nr:hypothetical protein [Filimonas lacunae]BAV06253.1 hypothetical protein FLA_2269 [Filimonas lacunae]SIT25483.1 hypothetical protein SAMN05421788_106320 [Filimonas lacunae]